NGARFEEALVEGINRARTAARLPAIELAPEQSKINEKLARHDLKAQLDEDHETLDQLGMSLLAGWHVKKGTIRRGNIFSTYLSGTRDIGDCLDFALGRPLGRSVLLDPEAQQVAVGPWPDERSQTLMSVVTTYAFFDSEKPAEN